MRSKGDKGWRVGLGVWRRDGRLNRSSLFGSAGRWGIENKVVNKKFFRSMRIQQ
jgi:hypothetical protein